MRLHDKQLYAWRHWKPCEASAISQTLRKTAKYSFYSFLYSGVARWRKVEGHKFSPRIEKQKKKKKKKTSRRRSIRLNVYTWPYMRVLWLKCKVNCCVTSILNLTFVFKGGGLGSSPRKFCKNWYKFLQF